MCLGCIGNVLLLGTLIYKQIATRIANRQPRIRTSGSSITTYPTRSPTDRGVFFKSTADYLLFLVIGVEFLCLWILVLRHTIYLGWEYDVRTLDQASCVIHTFVSVFSTNMAVAVLCIFSAHRMVSMRWPLASVRLFTRRRLNWCLVGVCAVILCKQIPLLLLIRLLPAEQGKYKCEAVQNNEYITLRHVYNYCEFFSHSLLGYTSLVFFNATLYFVLRKHNHSMKNSLKLDSSQSSQTTTNKSRAGQPRMHRDGTTASKIILLLSFVQVLSTLPYFLLVELHRIQKWNLFIGEQQVMVYYICILLVYTNSAFNYYLILGISKKFRTMTLEMLKFIVFCQTPQRVSEQSLQNTSRCGTYV
ncbi:uncharacterized protein DEA37_0002526 [Paragonimus westermani]|uniref:G-protein coupled receptors family 1 profile domain-containing protein n=1 Tax=Paragonimus westermani TaxID=34504 RepID=A0A5J4NZ88_9TREM|nr:uncharacterized protein DEA37_0002526 [Paragonimus westermani]